MPTFNYKAFNASGAAVSGVVEAESQQMAADMLFAQGYVPSSVKEKVIDTGSGLWARLLKMTQRVPAKDLIIFTKQFRSMMHAGVPLMRLLQVLEAQTQNTALKRAIGDISESIKEGSTLHTALERNSHIFSPLYYNLVKAGEVSGSVPEVLSRLVYIIEHEAKIKSDIKSALQYPMIVLIALVGAFFILLTFVVPKFASMFARSGLELPVPTQIALTLSELINDYWYIGLGGLIALVVGLRYFLKTEQGQYLKDALLLKLPLVGPLFVKAIMSRFASIFAILQSSGVPIMVSMKVLSGAIGNQAVAVEFGKVRDQMHEGRGISVPLSQAKYFTPMVIDMIAIGEESGNLEEMLQQVAVHYDDEVAYSVKGMSDAIGPILIVGLAAVVGFFALAIFMPMWDMTKLAR
ncbi:MAG TPA: type II secretion system F family protein [Syntrophales bacterium]|nr:type II secretion system F family protein [Syntrophales bacterium]